MSINLSKGQKVDLTKGNPSLKSIMVGLGWDVNAFHTITRSWEWIFNLAWDSFLTG